MKTLYRVVLAGVAAVSLSALAAQPERGMSMSQVESSFGHPKQKEAPVGKPPISRWVYDDYTVTFQGKTVIRVTPVSHEPTVQVITLPAADAPAAPVESAPADPAPAPLQADPVITEPVAEAAAPEEPAPTTPAIEALLSQPATAAGPELEATPPAAAEQPAVAPPPLPAEEPKPAAPAYRFDPATGRIVIDGL